MKYLKKEKVAKLININNTTYNYTLVKAIVVGFFVSAFLLLVINVTGAWFYRQEATQTTINVGNINIQATQINNPLTYQTQTTDLPISVTNLSNTHVVIRAYLNMHWVNGYPIGNVNALISTDWTAGSDGYYYYNFVLPPGDVQSQEAQFLTALEIFDDEFNKYYKQYYLNTYFEAAQYANSGYDNLWLTAPQEWLDIIS
jgi:hypothetical protein